MAEVGRIFAAMSGGGPNITVDTLQNALRDIMANAQATDDPFTVASQLIAQMDMDGDGLVSQSDVRSL